MIFVYGDDYADISTAHCWAMCSCNANASMNDKSVVRYCAQHA